VLKKLRNYFPAVGSIAMRGFPGAAMGNAEQDRIQDEVELSRVRKVSEAKRKQQVILVVRR
jgi:hypothetical protein